MKNVINLIPTILMVSLVPFFFYNEPSIAQSIIVSAITALVGYRYYLDSLQKPDYLKLFKEELERRDELHRKVTEDIYKDVADIREKQGKLNLVQTKEQNIKNFKW